MTRITEQARAAIEHALAEARAGAETAGLDVDLAIGIGLALVSIAESQERIADADEKRNELLVADAKERRESWARQQEEEDRRWAALSRGIDAELSAGEQA